MLSAEEQLARIRENQRRGAKKYRETHQLKRVGADITKEKYELFVEKLVKKNMTQKQFIENAIDKFLSE